MSRFRQVIAIDPRSLAAFRIGISVLLLLDLGIRATDLAAHYTDGGIAPRGAMADRYGTIFRWSLHALHGDAWFQATLFAVAALAAAAMLVGFHSRAACTASWLLLTSLHLRNPLINNGGDLLLRMLLLWAAFLPLDRVWSFASRRRGRSLHNAPIQSLASAAILLQVCLVYAMTGYFKYRGTWLEPEGFENILRFDFYAKGLAPWIAEQPGLAHAMGIGVVALELFGPLLALSPWKTRSIRMLLVPAFLLLHLGIELTLTVGLFGWVSMVAWLLFLPDVFWDRLLGASGIREGNEQTEATGRTGKQDIAGIAGGHGTWIAPLAWKQRMAHVLVAILLAYLLVWNIASVKRSWLRTVQAYSPPFAAQLIVGRQRWTMFSNVLRHDGWFVVVARLSDGRVVDLMRNGQPADWDSYTKPKQTYRRFPNHRWRKFYRHLATGQATFLTPSLCQYLAWQWNATHPDTTVESIELHFMEELASDPNGDGFMQRIMHTERFVPENEAWDSFSSDDTEGMTGREPEGGSDANASFASS